VLLVGLPYLRRSAALVAVDVTSSLESLRLGSIADSFNSLALDVYEEVSGFVVVGDGGVTTGVVTFGLGGSSSSSSDSSLLVSSSLLDSDSAFFGGSLAAGWDDWRNLL
jgi:hypothetical protein